MRQDSGRQGMAEIDAYSVIVAPGDPAEHLHEVRYLEGYKCAHAHPPLDHRPAARSCDVGRDYLLCGRLVALQDSAESQTEARFRALVEARNVGRVCGSELNCHPFSMTLEGEESLTPSPKSLPLLR